MTTTTLEYQEAPNNRGLLFSLAITATLIFVLFAGLKLSQHAIDRHSQDAFDAKRCYDNNGPFMKWLEPDKITVHFLCREGDKIYDVVQRWNKTIRDWDNVTAMRPSPGRPLGDYSNNTFNAIRRFFEGRGLTPWTGDIPPGG